jgi:glyoxylase-like metal-dependent hydrolase (beta-lactamase superfamily II)
MLEIERWAGAEASVNSWLIHGDESTLVVDVLRNSDEATALADHLEASQRRVSSVLVTHGHPDHFIGLGVMAARFPHAELLVAGDDVRASIIGFAGWMASVGWLEAEPHMKPRSADHPEGFDYTRLVTVSGSSIELDGGDHVELHVDHPATECDVMTTLSVPSANAYFPADLLYVGVHSWQGPDVDRRKIEAWIDTVERLAEELPADTRVLPGHGPETGVHAFHEMAEYLRHFLIATEPPTTRAAATEAITARYPDHRQADFLLAMSVDHHVPD